MKVIVMFIMIMMSFMPIINAETAQIDKVVIFNIEGEINASSLAMVKKAYQQANDDKANLIIMQMDTFGGQVDSAVKIRDIILESKIPTVCLIKNRAWSAGALIALAHSKIAMTTSASIGAAEPIPTTEKTVSALKAEFAATAGHTKRNVKIAEAMVDKSLGYEPYAAKGKILSLTQQEALAEKMADMSANDITELLKELNAEKAQQIKVEKTFRENFIGILNNPAVQSVLITIIIIGIITEVKTAGTGIAGIVALIAGIAVFGSNLLLDSGGMLPIILFLLGVGLLVAELFIPGFGIVGALGVGSMLASFFVVLGGNSKAMYWLLASMGGAVAFAYMLSKYLPSTGVYSKIILKAQSKEVKAGQVPNNILPIVYSEGVTVTMMRPAGKIKIADNTFDAMTAGEFLPLGQAVRVVKVQGDKIYVAAID